MIKYKYLDNKDFHIALEEYITLVKDCLSVQSLEKELINTKNSIGRINSIPIYAKTSSPNHLVSAVDGIATIWTKTSYATPTTPIFLEENQDFIYVDTGDKIPEGYNSVIMIEDLIYESEDRKKVKITNGITSYANIRQIGEDISQNELVVPINSYITPEIASLMIQTLNFEVEVYKKPIVTIIPTGDEIIEAEKYSTIKDDNTKAYYIESNSTIFSGYLNKWGAITQVTKVIKDDFSELCNAFESALENSNIILINAGSSAGRDDLTEKLINKYGKVITHGIAIKPGKPTILGIVDNKPVIGLPGYSVSGILIMQNIVKNVIKLWTIKDIEEESSINTSKFQAIISRKINSSLKSHDFVRVSVGKVLQNINVEPSYVATPLNAGSGVLSSWIKANGIFEIEKNIEGYNQFTKVYIQPLKNQKYIDNTILVTGSNDFIIDEINNLIQEKYPNSYINISSTNVGSMSGINIVKNFLCHIAPIHILDETTGTYNQTIFSQYLNNDEFELIAGVKRTQGLITKKGNPHNISSIKDISSKKLKFVNRQLGSGTRILFDYILKKENISKQEIIDYERIEFTHNQVALQIAKSTCDCGLGIQAVSKLYNLDFIPIAEENYDFVVPKYFVNEEKFQIFHDILRSKALEKRMNEIYGGYKF